MNFFDDEEEENKDEQKTNNNDLLQRPHSDNESFNKTAEGFMRNKHLLSHNSNEELPIKS